MAPGLPSSLSRRQKGLEGSIGSGKQAHRLHQVASLQCRCEGTEWAAEARQ